MNNCLGRIGPLVIQLICAVGSMPTDIADDHGQEQVFRRPHRRDADFLAVEVSDAADLGEGLGLLLSDPLLGEALPSPAAVTYRSRSAGSLIRPQDARSLGGRDGQPFRQDRAYRSSDAGKPTTPTRSRVTSRISAISAISRTGRAPGVAALYVSRTGLGRDRQQPAPEL